MKITRQWLDSATNEILERKKEYKHGYARALADTKAAVRELLNDTKVLSIEQWSTFSNTIDKALAAIEALEVKP